MLCRVELSQSYDESCCNYYCARTGEETHVITVPEMLNMLMVNDPPHAHGVNDPGHEHSVYGYNVDAAGGSARASWATPGGNPASTTHNGTGISINGAVTGVSIQNAGGNNGHENVQPTVFVPYIVKLDG
jgi:microcystin-dependent protein